MTILYECLEPFPTAYTLEELVERCLKRDYPSTFKNPKTDIRKSILYHLNRLRKGTLRVPRNSIREVRESDVET